ncbi:WD40 repeat-like protein [Lophiostoma macrostomum CBS 122681]|uniref:WD40 repeat-like protein n=1 Tax=Lophiostoma macrostomum CBS 122681 TaxID=1314788 RepID=A0A6A6T456_9PLEO|nr:WD40 repeat-like protein [Lophiostoma macrostomum CBS 122681]
MDIHRSRFVPYPPSAINALAFSHTQPSQGGNDPASLRLAVGRANGNIEIWNPAEGAWLQERVFTGGKDRSVEGLTWIQEPSETNEQGKTVPGKLRLFSIGYSSTVTEWDLATGLPARHSDGNHSEVWCIAAQPLTQNTKRQSGNSGLNERQDLVAGCADGTLVLLSTEDNDLRFTKFLSRSTTKRARVLSVTYKDRNTLLAGFADSTIRVYNTRNGQVVRTISLGSGPPGGPKEILVWKIKCLANGDFVSGDSTGDIRIYEGRNYSQLQRISGHEADILDLAVSQDGTTIFSGGMDRRTCIYTSKKTKGNRAEDWRKVEHKRFHEHDVKALASYEGRKLNVVVSGGIDTQPIVFPLRRFGLEHSRSLSCLPHEPPLASAIEARLMVSWWNCELRLWHVKDQEEGAEKPKVVARVALQGDENITSVSITHDGNLLAVSTASEVKLFQIIRRNPATGPAFRIRKLTMPTSFGGRLVRLTANGKWLAIVTCDNSVHLVRIIRSDDASERPRVVPRSLYLRRISRESRHPDNQHNQLGLYDRSITHADFAADGTTFATADLAGYIDTWLIEGHEDLTAPEVDVAEASSSSESGDESDEDDESSQERVTLLGQRWIRNPSGHLLPRLDSIPLLLAFQPVPEDSLRREPNGNPAVHPTRGNPHPHSHDLPDTEQHLLVVSAQHHLHHFEVLAGRLSDWSRRNPPSSYPARYRQLDGAAKGCLWDISENKQRLWLYGEKWLFMFDLSRDLALSQPTEPSEKANDGQNGTSILKKRKRELGSSGAGGLATQKDLPVTKMRKFDIGKIDESSSSSWIDLNNARRGDESDEEVEDTNNVLASLRRSAADMNAPHADDSIINGDVAREDDTVSGEEENRRPEPWWHTFKYRPILGIVPISVESQPLEVILVERPTWDLDLPPRFVGSHEKEVA